MQANNMTTRHGGSVEYIGRECATAGRKLAEMQARRQIASEAREQAAQLADSAARIERARWAMDGHYGSEFAVYIDAQYTREMAHAKTPLQRRRAAKWAGMTAYQVAALADFDALNAAGITRALKAAGYDKADFDALNDKLADLAETYYRDEE